MPATRTSGRRVSQQAVDDSHSSSVTPRSKRGRRTDQPESSELPQSAIDEIDATASSTISPVAGTSEKKRKRTSGPDFYADDVPAAKETPTKRSRRSGAQPSIANEDRNSPDGQKSEERESVDELAQTSPAVKATAADDIGLRSSARTRKKTAKQFELEEVRANKTRSDITPSRTNLGTKKMTPSQRMHVTDDATPTRSNQKARGRASAQKSKNSTPSVNLGTETGQVVGTMSAKSPKRPGVRGGKGAPQVLTSTEDDVEDAVDEIAVQSPGTRTLLDQDRPDISSTATSVNNTPSRKRGRPSGPSKRAAEQPRSDLPFEDVPLDTSAAKPRKGLLPTQQSRDSSEDLIATAMAATANLPLLASALSTTAPKISTVPNEDGSCASTAAELEKLLERPDMATAFMNLRRLNLTRCSGRTPIPITGLEKEYAAIHAVIQQTVAAGEGNSLLVIGARGSGKSAAVETALADIHRTHGDDFHVVRLNGFVHTDDKVALREIWRQLGRETQPEAFSGGKQQRINYADTLASLLAVLSHPTELEGNVVEAESGPRKKKKAQAEPEQTAARAVIVILDEFDQFATHARQTLLYNLLDVAQARKAPLAVLGLTTRLDAAEALEKRVKSRFSHRHVHIAPPRTFGAFLDVIRSALGCAPSDPSRSLPPALLEAWSAHVTSCLAAAPLSTHLRRIFAHTKSVPQALHSLLPALAATSATNLPLPSTLAASFPTLAPPDSKLPALLPALSDSELALLAAAARLDALHATDAVASFALAFDEYARLARRAAVQGATPGGIGAGARAWGRDVCLAAWDGLAGKGLLVPVVVGEGGRGGGAGTGGTADTGRAGRLWRVDVSLEEIGRGIDAWGGGGAAAREVGRWCKVL